MGPRVSTADVAFLLSIAADSGDPGRQDALTALDALPLDDPARHAVDLLRAGDGATIEDGTEGPGTQPPGRPPETTGAQVASPEAARAAATVRDALLEAEFPADLSELGGLPPLIADGLLTSVVDALLLARTRPALRAAVGRGTTRLSGIRAALSAEGRRPVTAGMPDARLLAVPDGDRAWVGGLLTLVHPRDVLAAARWAVEATQRRRDALRWLAGVAGRLGVPPQALPVLGSAGDLAALQRLVELALPARRPTRSAESSPPAPRLPAQADAAPPVPQPPVPASPGTRTAHARLDAPARVLPGADFELRVGLADVPDARVAAPHALVVPDAAFTLKVTVLADGFDVLGGASTDRVIGVTPADPYPYDVVRLRARDDPLLAEARAILGMYYVDDRLAGVATRAVLVSSDPGARTPAPPTDVDWPLPATGSDRPDVEIVVARGNDEAGRTLLWHCRSRHPGGGSATEAVTLDDDVAAAVKEFLKGVESRASQPSLPYYLAGVAGRLARAVGDTVWSALAAASAAVGGAPPTVLLASGDAYLPWELARAPRPWLDAPAALGAQAVVGRWPYRTPAQSPAPPSELDLATMAVVSGVYPEGQRLEEAEKEGAGLAQAYEAAAVSATQSDVLRCLEGDPRVDVLHVAAHGRFDSTGTQDGIRMLDGTYLAPLDVEGIQQGAVRLAFLNACQLGQGREVLGEYAGMAAALLTIGADAVVAPLWKVDDVVAREVAEAFYPAVLSGRMSPAAFLREQRAATSGLQGAGETRLAYVYFGHPTLHVNWKGPVHDD